MIKDNERAIVRELAKKLADLAEQPIMEQRRKLWYDHNDLKTDFPVIDCSPEGAWRELITPESLQCEDAEMREIEWELRARIYRAEVINDDVPAERTWMSRKFIKDIDFLVDGKSVPPAFANSFCRMTSISSLPYIWKPGFVWHDEAEEFKPMISDDDMEDSDVASRVSSRPVEYDAEASAARLALHQDLLGDILDVQDTGINYFFAELMQTYTAIRGYQNMLYDVYDYPDEMHEIIKVIMGEYLKHYKDLEAMGLISMNNSCHYTGTGGYGYTHDLNAPADGSPITLKNLWAHAESQEFVCVSPEMTREFAIDYERDFLENFGLSCYGCCDNLENKLNDVFTIKNIRRISVAPWADVASMRDQIGMKAIFSCKPNPSLITNGWDEESQRKYITQLLEDGKGTPFEIILKDTHTIQNDPYRFRKWTDLVRECVQNVYGA